MSNVLRKIKRNNLPKKKQELKKLQEKINMFDRLPDNCSVCQKPFDKKSREMAFTWVVTVKYDQGKVSLFCPECIEKTKQFLKASGLEEENIEQENDEET